MTNRFVLCFMLMLQVVSTQAADQLLLYHVSKQVHWVHDGKSDAAKRGVFLLPKHRLIITSQSNVMLVQQDGKSMLLDKPGTYTYSQIKLMMQKLKTESVSKNFFAYVFEKFLTGDDEEKQKVAAVVYRGKTVMYSPADSSFVFSSPVLTWKPEKASIPYKIEITINHTVFDTIIRKQTSLVIPQRLLNTQPQLVKWTCYPADSKQKPQPFILLIPNKGDAAIIKQQLALLKKDFGTNPALLRLMNNDLLMHWIATYQLN